MSCLLSYGNIRHFSTLVSVSLVLLCLGCVRCSGSTASVTSDLTGPMILAGELTLLGGGHMGKEKAIDGAKALFATGIVTEALKVTVREKRPNSDSTDSFPSAHTAGAFAMATVLSDYRPSCKWLAYGAAAAVGWSRVEEDQHRWRDVIAGALIGHFVASKFTGRHVALTPQGIAFQANW
ncbi:MAG: phosphatase PAP2 family protein [Armatimonadota bacterium]